MRNSRSLAKDAAGNTADWSLPFIVKLNIMITHHAPRVNPHDQTNQTYLARSKNENKLRKK